MNYLTKYYKNLSEQLQEKVNHLQKLLEAYPGGMTPERHNILHKASLQQYRPDATPETVAKSQRARDLMKKGYATDVRKAHEELMQKHAKVSSMPDFHNKVVSAFSSAFANQYAGNPEQTTALSQKISDKLHKAAGKGGFKSYKHASDAMRNIMHEDETLRDHLEYEADQDPLKYGVDHDHIMDVDMGDEVDDHHADLDHAVLHSLLKSK